MEQANAGYLVEILTVDRVEDGDPEEDSRRYVVEGQPERCLAVVPPLLVDAILRPPGRGRDEPIGAFLQGAQSLPTDKVDRLVRLLRSERPGLWERLTGR